MLDVSHIHLHPTASVV